MAPCVVLSFSFLSVFFLLHERKRKSLIVIKCKWLSKAFLARNVSEYVSLWLGFFSCEGLFDSALALFFFLRRMLLGWTPACHNFLSSCSCFLISFSLITLRKIEEEQVWIYKVKHKFANTWFSDWNFEPFLAFYFEK
jgi:hypothetical protein